jgi:hypothetical protein
VALFGGVRARLDALGYVVASDGVQSGVTPKSLPSGGQGYAAAWVRHHALDAHGYPAALGYGSGSRQSRVLAGEE